MEQVATWAVTLAFQSQGPEMAWREERGRTDMLSDVALYTDFLSFLTEATPRAARQETRCP